MMIYKNRYTIQRIIVSLLLSILIGAHTFTTKAQDTLQVVTEYAPFILFERVNSSESGYKTPEEVRKDWHIYAVSRGTKVVAMGYDSYDGLLRVKLPDESIGYMPTISFALGCTFNHVKEYTQYPPGQYRLIGVGTMQYLQAIDQYIPVQPDNYYIQHEDGSRYTIPTNSLTHIEGELRFTGWDGPSIFEGFYNQHPNIHEIPDRNDRCVNFKLKEGELPTGYIGCSRSYIESVLGEPYSYAGVGISQYKGYTFSCHNNVAWDTPVNKKNDAAGLIIYYDENQRAVYMEKKPIAWYFDDIFTKLLVPTHPIDTIQADIAGKIAQSEGRRVYYYNSQAQPVQEIYSAPHTLDRLYIGAMYFVENTLGIKNMWLIALVMIAVQYILMIPAYCAKQAKDKIPGWILRIVILLLTVPFTIYCIAYITRLHFILACLAALFILGPALLIIIDVFASTQMYRCAKCKTWHKKFNVLHAEELDRYFTSPQIDFDTQREVFSKRSSGYSGGTWVSTSDRGYNYKTTVNFVKRMRYRYQCPNCHHEWVENGESSRPLPGPICFTGHISTKQEWKETEVTKTRYMLDGTVIHEEEDSRDVTRSSSGGSSSRRFDIERYNQYLRRYQREKDIKILYKYESEFYGNYFGE